VTVSRVRIDERPWGTLVELCAPEVRNALDRQTVADLTAAFRGPGSGAIVLAGRGPVFCGGGDVAAMSAATSRGDLMELFAEAGEAFADLTEAIVGGPRPAVAAIQGAAVGGGISLALACDVRVAGRSTRLIPGWGRWGLPPDGGASALLAAAVGPAAAAAFLVRGQELTTASPLAPLLFDEVVDDEAVLETAIALAQRIHDNRGAAAAKSVARELRLPLLRAQRGAELAALRAAAEDPAVVAALGRGIGSPS
jgi:2-(1,2-epoxy-1,2-dihydrophenyl)acetyl-CoA isomerase